MLSGIRCACTHFSKVGEAFMHLAVNLYINDSFKDKLEQVLNKYASSYVKRTAIDFSK